MNIRFSYLMPAFPLGNFNCTDTSETVQENKHILQNSFSKAQVIYFPFEHDHDDEDRNPNRHYQIRDNMKITMIINGLEYFNSIQNLRTNHLFLVICQVYTLIFRCVCGECRQMPTQTESTCCSQDQSRTTQAS